MTTPIAAFLVLLGLIVAAGPVGWLLSHRRLRALRASGTYPAAGKETEADVARLQAAGETVLAVRCYRALHHVSLVEAHSAILGRPKQRGLPAIFFGSSLFSVEWG
jgi:hypothetical protein